MYRSAQNHLSQVETLGRAFPSRPDKSAQLAKILTELQAAQNDVEALGWAYDRIGWVRPAWRAIPVIGERIDAYPQLLIIVRRGLPIAVLGVKGARDILSGTSPEEPLVRALGWLDQNRESVLGAALAMRTIQFELGQIQDAWLSASLHDRITTLRDLLAQVDPMLDLLQSRLEPGLVAAGMRGPRTYLLLFQNNLELRPTGGFIGLYGLVQLENGKLALEIHDVSDFPNAQLQAHGVPASPQPLRDFIGVKDLFFRDINWAPDFPSVAQTASDYYALEFGAAPDGVIAVNFAFVLSLLQVLGPVHILGSTESITPDNLYTQYMLERDESQREGTTAYKSRLAELGYSLLERARSVDMTTMLTLGRTILAGLEQKQILISLEEPALRSWLREMNWDGAIRATEGDYVSINDANLSGFKISQAIEQQVTQSITLNPEGTTARTTLVMTVTNPISRTQRIYRRLYLPASSRLESFDMQVFWENQEVAQVNIEWSQNRVASRTLRDPDHNIWRWMGRAPYIAPDVVYSYGKASVGLPLPVAKNGGQTVLRLTYNTPVVSPVDSGGREYRLLIQRQPGAEPFPYRVTLVLPSSVQAVLRADGLEANGANTFQGLQQLDRDREFVLEFK